MPPNSIATWGVPLVLSAILLVVVGVFALWLRRGAARGRHGAPGSLGAAHLDVVLDNIPSAFLLLDAQLHLVASNRRFLEIFDLPESLGSPGIPIVELIRHIAEQGGYGPGPVDELVSRRMEDLHKALTNPASATKEISLSNDRVGQAQYALTPDGLLVGIITDITEQKQNEDALEAAYDVIKDAYDLSQEQKSRMERELNIAHDIQMSMIPLDFPTVHEQSPFSIFASLHPAREVGGDFYDFFFIDDTRLYICLGDVSGKGVPSALFMAVAKALMKSRASDDTSTGSILTHVNNELGADNRSQLFVTVFLGILDIETGELHFTNGGHNPPYIKKQNGELRCLHAIHGPIVGAFQGMAYEEEVLRMDPRDLLFLFTDGVTEARSHGGEMYSEQALEELLGSLEDSHPKMVIDSVSEALKSYTRRAEQSDDITMLAVQFLGRKS